MVAPGVMRFHMDLDVVSNRYRCVAFAFEKWRTEVVLSVPRCWQSMRRLSLCGKANIAACSMIINLRLFGNVDFVDFFLA